MLLKIIKIINKKKSVDEHILKLPTTKKKCLQKMDKRVNGDRRGFNYQIRWFTYDINSILNVNITIRVMLGFHSFYLKKYLNNMSL